jgi:hypothetical protein
LCGFGGAVVGVVNKTPESTRSKLSKLCIWVRLLAECQNVSEQAEAAEEVYEGDMECDEDGQDEEEGAV